MGRLLYIQASPRGERSKSIAVAQAFAEAYLNVNPGGEVNTINLFTKDLPAFEGLVLSAKYNILHGEDATPEEKAAWKEVKDIIAEFKSAHKYLFAVPMWNFGIPYRLKHYIDILVQPTYTFSYTSEEGYKGLVTDKPACIVYARGGDYSSADSRAMDFQRRYLEAVLGFIGFSDLKSIVVEPTLMGGPEVAGAKMDAAIGRAIEIAREF